MWTSREDIERMIQVELSKQRPLVALTTHHTAHGETATNVLDYRHLKCVPAIGTRVYLSDDRSGLVREVNNFTREGAAVDAEVVLDLYK